MTESSKKQLEQWVKGTPEHNDERGECCPDFSCCVPSLLASDEDRRLYADACESGNDAVKMAMLGGFLGRAMEQHGKPKVHLAGFTDGEGN